KEQLIALDVYGLGSDFDPGRDPIVRVDARRLRDKLREYYAEFPTERVLITIPKGSYAPVFILNELNASTGTIGGRRPHLGWVAAGLVWALGGVLLSFRTSPVTELHLRPIASVPGMKGPPSLSPDGDLVAFVWSGPAEKASPGIYVQPVDGG